MGAEAKVKELGLDLTHPSGPVANYVPAVTVGKLVYLSGKGPNRPDGSQVTGKAGSERTVDEAYDAARLCGIQLLSALKEHVGSLDNVKRVVKLLGMVNATPDFADQPKVINGCSDLLVSIFGENGKHARSAVGMGSLPGQITVEIEMIVELN
ncbi:MAG: RidA family protein [Chloroflexi bacterium]|jgi:enamine deaminase RidA (YjgF/YER057c/UK114 family)|nr:RidA family protein [Chloroflexota bacterium]MDA1282332.1 RidA family protein [Chloroflexota bacterium]